MRAVSVMVVVSLAASVALAQGGDVVILANGGRLRGTVEVYEPGADLVIVLSDGTRRVVPAADVAQVVFADVVPAPAPEAPEAPADITPPAAPPAFVPTPPPSAAPPPAAPASPPAAGGAEGGGTIPEMQHLTTLESIAGVPEGAAREYAPGERAAAEWVDDPELAELPRGSLEPLHLGFEIRAGFQVFPGTLDAFSGAFDLSAVVLLRPLPRFHVRLAPLVGVDSVTISEYPYDRSNPRVRLGARIQLGFELDRFLILRVGAELGTGYVENVDQWGLYGGPELDLLGALLDGGNLEVGLAVTPLFAAFCGPMDCSQRFTVRPQVLIGGIF